MEHLGMLYELHDDDMEFYFEELDERPHPNTIVDTPSDPRLVPVRIDLRILVADDKRTLPILEWENGEPIMYIPWIMPKLPPGVHMRRGVDETTILDRVLRKYKPKLRMYRHTYKEAIVSHDLDEAAAIHPTEDVVTSASRWKGR